MGINNTARYLEEGIAKIYDKIKHAKKSVKPSIAAALVAVALAGDAKASEISALSQDENRSKNTAIVKEDTALLESRINKNPKNKLGIRGFRIDEKDAEESSAKPVNAEDAEHQDGSQCPLSADQYPIIYPAHVTRPAYANQSPLIFPSTRMQLPPQMMLRKSKLDDLAETAAALYAAFLFKTVNHEEGHASKARDRGTPYEIAINIGGLTLASNSEIGKDLSILNGRVISNGTGITKRQDISSSMGGFSASQNAYEGLTRMIENGNIDPNSAEGKFLRFSRLLTGIDFGSYYLFNPPGTDYDFSDINALDAHGLGKNMKQALFADALKIAGVSVRIRIPGTDYIWKFTPSAQYDTANGVMGPGFFSEIVYSPKKRR